MEVNMTNDVLRQLFDERARRMDIDLCAQQKRYRIFLHVGHHYFNALRFTDDQLRLVAIWNSVTPDMFSDMTCGLTYNAGWAYEYLQNSVYGRLAELVDRNTLRGVESMGKMDRESSYAIFSLKEAIEERRMPQHIYEQLEEVCYKWLPHSYLFYRIKEIGKQQYQEEIEKAVKKRDALLRATVAERKI